MIAFFHYDIGYPTRVTIALAAWSLLSRMGFLLGGLRMTILRVSS